MKQEESDSSHVFRFHGVRNPRVDKKRAIGRKGTRKESNREKRNEKRE